MYFRNLYEKNISKLNVNNTNYSDIEDDLISIFYSLDTEELLDLIPINRYLDGEAVWITPNGTVLRLDVHSNISSDLFYYMCEHELSNIYEYTADDFALQDEFDFCDHLTDELNWIKFNTGNGFYDERCYVVLPYKITSKQYNVLEELISQTMTNSDGLLVLTDKPSVKQIYPYNIYSENDIIKKIKRYTVNGILEEGIFLESKEDQQKFIYKFSQKVFDESYLIEDKQSVRKNYPNISDEQFEEIISIDPTYKPNSNSVGTYGKWLLNLAKKQPAWENGYTYSEITDLLSKFDSYKKDRKYKLSTNDINKIKGIYELNDIIENVEENELSDRQKSRERKSSKDYEHLGSIGDWDVYTPTTMNGAIALGTGTSWCTAYDSADNRFNQYNDKGPLYILINKNNKSEKYQFHEETDSFMDKNDDIVDTFSFTNDNYELIKWLNDNHYGDFNKELEAIKKLEESKWTWRYNGEKIPDEYKALIKKVIIEDGVKRIRDDAFYDCISLESIIIPNSITIIEESAFYNCISLESITIPNGVKEIRKYAFCECESLKSITIPNSVTKIGMFALRDCTSLQSITIPNSVRSIGYGTFYKCKSLQSITLPNSVTEIGRSTFSNCTSLQSITIPNSVKVIEGYAFYNCKSLKNVYYSGTKNEWNNIDITYDNKSLSSAKIHFNSNVSESYKFRFKRSV